jgi:hypothetical protein
MSFGVLTLATPGDYMKAIGLALSIRVSNPGVPVAVACAPPLRAKLSPHFDYVLEKIPSVKGFEHKIHLDHYSPFDDTFFFDSDVLVFKDLRPIAEEWGDQPYNACGVYTTTGLSAFGFDRAKALARLSRDRLVTIDGAGHAYFRKPQCAAVFDLARRVAADYRNWAGDIRFADEDCMNVVLTQLDLQPRPHLGFFSRYMSAAPGTLQLNATEGRCVMVERSSGQRVAPCMMHFAAREAPFPYTRELRRLFRKFGVETGGLFRLALTDFWDLEVERRGKAYVKRLLGRTKRTGIALT